MCSSGRDEPEREKAEDPAFAPRLGWDPERRLTDIVAFDGIN